jgi:hypothetical protein
VIGERPTEILGNYTRYIAFGSVVWDMVNGNEYQRYLSGPSAQAAAEVLNRHADKIRTEHGMPLIKPLWMRRKHPKAHIGFGPQSMGYTL